MRVFVYFLFFYFGGAARLGRNEFCFPGQEWCLDPDWHADGDLWVVIQREWKPNYGSPFRYLMVCGDGTDDCNIPRYWEYSMEVFASFTGALQWVNKQFREAPERFVSVRKLGRPEAVFTTTKVRTESKHIEETTWASNRTAFN